jgi:replication-associated recombination protein RarA
MSDPLSDRLPTVSASEALLSLQSRGPRSISTGLNQLNAILGTSKSGLARGNLTEIWGPAGSGKTSLAYVRPLLPSSTTANIPVDCRRQHTP